MRKVGGHILPQNFDRIRRAFGILFYWSCAMVIYLEVVLAIGAFHVFIYVWIDRQQDLNKCIVKIGTTVYSIYSVGRDIGLIRALIRVY
jgi:hypothetical protein